MGRLLILHALLGTGHLSAARALKAAFDQVGGAEAIVEDSLDFINPALSRLWKGAYKELSERADNLYSRLYRSSDRHQGRAAQGGPRHRRAGHGRPGVGSWLGVLGATPAPQGAACTPCG